MVLIRTLDTSTLPTSAITVSGDSTNQPFVAPFPHALKLDRLDSSIRTRRPQHVIHRTVLQRQHPDVRACVSVEFGTAAAHFHPPFQFHPHRTGRSFD
jgi:hypothetical protein